MFRTIALAAIASLALTGCIKHEPYDHHGHGQPGGDNGRTDDKLLLVKQDDWTVRYMGRKNVVYDDGSNSVVELFQMNCSGAYNLFPLIISPDDLKNVYNNDLLDFFEYEVGLLQNDAKADPSVPLSDLGVYSGKAKSVEFGRHMHGTWLLYVPELDSKLNLTGKYAELEFTIEEEKATESFARWYGTYHVYDGYCGFDITISDADANYLYYVDGWETGPSVSEQMTQERDWLYARYADGRLIFYAQFLTTEEYNKMNVKQVFAGTWLTPTSDTIGDVDWEGVELEDPVAYAFEEDGKVMLRPWTVTFDNGSVMTYHSMRYTRLWYTDNGATVNWAFYNTAGVPSLPANMDFIPGTRANSAPVVRQRTKGSVHRDQLKPAGPSRVRKWTEK